MRTTLAFNLGLAALLLSAATSGAGAATKKSTFKAPFRPRLLAGRR
jgi:hypothetical protein